MRPEAVLPAQKPLDLGPVSEETIYRHEAMAAPRDELSVPERPSAEPLIYGGRFVCRELLGRGGMGHVYKAWQESVGRWVAIKSITSMQTLSNDAKQRFRRELRMAGQLEHPNLIRVYDGDIQGDHPYIAMEYVEGTTLQDLVKNDGPRPWRQVCEWIAQTADGLAYAHEMKVIHRDIKPGNLMLTSRGAVKVLDLGLARFLDGDDDLTQSNAAMGTIDYMAPEQYEDAKRADERSDIYSLGCTLYFLCAGKTLFAHRNKLMNKLYAHVHEAPPALRDGCLDAPTELEAIFQKMVMKQPGDRYRTMAEIGGALRGLGASRIASPASDFASACSSALREPRPIESPKSALRVESVLDGDRPIKERTDNGLGMTMVWRPAGRFLMGSPEGEPGRKPNEVQVRVSLTHGTWIKNSPVTQAEYQRIVGKTPSRFSPDQFGAEAARFPAENVSWYDAMTFCRLLTDQERAAGRLADDWEYRLPTEAEWECACRAGTTTATAFGDSLSSRQANFDGAKPYNSAEPGPALGRPCPVGGYPPNAWGIYDMHANVMEWCLDWYEETLRGGEDPIVTIGSGFKVYRGGSWSTPGSLCRSAHRFRFSPDARLDYVGFRIVAAPYLVPK